MSFKAGSTPVFVESDWHLLELTRYIAMNPVRAGLCASPAEWRWSSFCDVIRGPHSSLHTADRVLAFFGADEDRARQAFGRFVDEARVELGLVSF
jgi:putative transposase